MYILSVAYDIDDYRSEAHLSDGIDFSVETAEEAAEMVSYFIKKGFEVSVSKG